MRSCLQVHVPESVQNPRAETKTLHQRKGRVHPTIHHVITWHCDVTTYHPLCDQVISGSGGSGVSGGPRSGWVLGAGGGVPAWWRRRHVCDSIRPSRLPVNSGWGAKTINRIPCTTPNPTFEPKKNSGQSFHWFTGKLKTAHTPTFDAEILAKRWRVFRGWLRGKCYGCFSGRLFVTMTTAAGWLTQATLLAEAARPKMHEHRKWYRNLTSLPPWQHSP